MTTELSNSGTQAFTSEIPYAKMLPVHVPYIPSGQKCILSIPGQLGVNLGPKRSNSADDDHEEQEVTGLFADNLYSKYESVDSESSEIQTFFSQVQIMVLNNWFW